MGHYYYITPDEYDRAEQNGISAITLERRVRLLAWDKERALTEPPQKKTNIKKWADIAKKNGVKYETFRARLRRGMSFEEAATRPLANVADRRRTVSEARKKRRVFDSEIVEKAERNGISYDTFYRRVERGWNEEDAATHPIMSKREIGLMMKDERRLGRFV